MLAVCSIGYVMFEPTVNHCGLFYLGLELELGLRHKKAVLLLHKTAFRESEVYICICYLLQTNSSIPLYLLKSEKLFRIINYWIIIKTVNNAVICVLDNIQLQQLINQLFRNIVIIGIK